ncbi:MAG: hypothetical protein PF961_05925 [Planctomycetota bacterium]|nr:hypothetical protein [Planctomycetota bacterium]
MTYSVWGTLQPRLATPRRGGMMLTMAVVGSDKGFRKVITMALATVMLTAPFLFLTLDSRGLALSRSDKGLATVSVRLLNAKRSLRCSATLSSYIPEEYPLKAAVTMTTADGTVIANYRVDQVDFARRMGQLQRDRIMIQGPTLVRMQPHSAVVKLVLFRDGDVLLTVHGLYEPPAVRLTNITEHKPGEPVPPPVIAKPAPPTPEPPSTTPPQAAPEPPTTPPQAAPADPSTPTQTGAAREEQPLSTPP